MILLRPRLSIVVSLAALMIVSNCKTTEAPLVGAAVDDIAGKHNAAEARLSTAASNAIAEGKTAEALAIYKRLYEDNKLDRDVSLNYAQLLRKSGRAEESIPVLTPFLDKRSRRRLGEEIIDSVMLNEYAAAKIETGDFATAQDYLQRVLSDPTAMDAHADAHHLQGIVLDAQGRYKEAEKSYRSALSGWKGDATSIMNNLGINLANQGLFDESLLTLRQALVMAPRKEEIAQNIQVVTDLRKSVMPKAPVVLKK